MHFKVLLLSLFIFFIYPKGTFASCLILKTKDKMPQTIEKNMCIEMQGDQKLEGRIVNNGTLIIKASRSVILQGNIVNKARSKLIVRGDLLCQKKSSLIFEPSAKGEIHGSLVLKDKSLLNLENATFLNKGRLFLIDKSSIDANSSKLVSSGTFSLDNSKILFKDGILESRGKLTAERAKIDFISKAIFLNKARLDVDDKSLFTFHDMSYLKSSRRINLLGVFAFLDKSYFENSSILDISNRSTLILQSKAKSINKDDINIYGALLVNNSNLINKGHIQIKKEGIFKIVDKSYVNNLGTMREDGVILKDDSSKLDNKNIIYDSKLQRQYL